MMDNSSQTLLDVNELNPESIHLRSECERLREALQREQLRADMSEQQLAVANKKLSEQQVHMQDST
jgi:hypothetical protein